MSQVTGTVRLLELEGSLGEAMHVEFVVEFHRE